jgi:hypothetical protein
MLATLFVLSISVLMAADWAQFRGPHGLGVSDEKDLPTKWSSTENIVWKTDLPGPGASCPVTHGDRVFITCYSGYGLEPNIGRSERSAASSALSESRRRLGNLAQEV